ncbi:leucine-rich_repeat domain-containing protein [Hexamita inflata]|uniref:Leucine-rich repeat domain-containing protein n=1 Tax=Hexamita inflata TaxID=28002 RepID=A0AA86PDH4_9EUKA|nr:leucine-rich repeat domain-containing protein [Hexamita inflata]
MNSMKFDNQNNTSYTSQVKADEFLKLKYINKINNGCLIVDDDIHVQSLKFLDLLPEVIQLTVLNCKHISLAQAPQLITHLKICNCGISHLSGISQMKKLQQVQMTDNIPIFEDLFSNLPELKSLQLENNKFIVQTHNIKPIDQYFSKYKTKSQQIENYDLIMTNKYKSYVLSSGKMSKISDKDITSIKFVDELIRPLKNGRTQIKLIGCWNLNFVQTPIKVNDLNISYCRLQDINGIQQMDLVAPNLSSNEIVDLEPLRGLKNLKELSLACNMIIFIDALRDMVKLTEAHLDYNRIHDFTPIQHHKRFAEYTKVDQIVATNAEIYQALRLNIIHKQFEFIYKNKILYRKTLLQFSKTKEQITQFSNSLYFNQIQSMNKITKLFQQFQASSMRYE